jgi:dipeptidyl aminopeptidase/acylaminoacyl peptidase
VTDLAEFFGGLREWVDATGDAPVRYAYGPHPDQHADLRLPHGAGPHPVAVVLHGGFWRASFTSANTAALACALSHAGLATWNVEYRRVGSDGGHPETLEDVAAACAALRDVAEPIEHEPCLAIGHSAGGQLALWLAGEGLVASAVALAGVCDLVAAAAAGLGDHAVPGYLGAQPREAPDRYAEADPSQRLPTGQRLLLVHGDRDDRVPLEQSTAFQIAARAAGDDCELLLLEGAGHFDVIDPRAPVWPRMLDAILRSRR